jgi:hypothetical protein
MVTNCPANGLHLGHEVRTGARFNDAFASMVVAGDNRDRIRGQFTKRNTAYA